MNVKEKINQLFNQEKKQKLKEFNAKLIPNIDASTVLGIRLPTLRKLAKQLYRECDCAPFLRDLPHSYHEENHLHAFLIEQVKNFDECLSLTQEFLPHVDNWAVCDCFKPPVFKNNKERLLVEIKKWLTSEHTYTIRFAISMLLTHFLDEDFELWQANLVASVDSQEYYVKMMVAWYFATALAKKYDKVIHFIEDGKLNVWTHNKTIQKAIESFRVSEKQKDYLKTLKRKGEQK